MSMKYIENYLWRAGISCADTHISIDLWWHDLHMRTRVLWDSWAYAKATKTSIWERIRCVRNGVKFYCFDYRERWCGHIVCQTSKMMLKFDCNHEYCFMTPIGESRHGDGKETAKSRKVKSLNDVSIYGLWLWSHCHDNIRMISICLV